jgi:lipopolysaccharide transport system permease protein
VPLAAVVGGLADFGVAFLLLLAVMVFYGVTPGIAVLALPLLVLFAIATAFRSGSVAFSAERAVSRCPLHAGLRDAALDVRDPGRLFRIARPRGLACALWAQPDGRRRRRLSLGALESLCGARPEILVSIAAVAALLVSGLYYFRRVERTFADVI